MPMQATKFITQNFILLHFRIPGGRVLHIIYFANISYIIVNYNIWNK